MLQSMRSGRIQLLVYLAGQSNTAMLLADRVLSTAEPATERFSLGTLEALPRGATYALWLTRDGKLADQCGTFVAGPTPTEVALNAPYRLKDYDGWVVVRAGSTQPFVLRTAAV